MSTQNARLLLWLETHDGITTAEATAALKCYRLSERIRELESLGYQISHSPETTPGGARVIRYRLKNSAARSAGGQASGRPLIDNALASGETGPNVAAEPRFMTIAGKRVEIIEEVQTEYAKLVYVRDTA